MNRKMKDSGVEWIGEIPEDWEVKRIKEILEERIEKNKNLELNTILSLSAKNGVTLYDEKNHSGNKPSEDLSKYKIVRNNDIVVNSMNIIAGSVGLSKYEGCISQVYYIYHNKLDNNIKFIYYIFKCKQFQESLKGLGNGILIKETDKGNLNTIRTKIPSNKLIMQYSVYCKKMIQDKIVETLDKKCTQIDTLIQNQQQQIEKLKQYKQSLITETVTKGLEPNVPMKDSGVEWIGEIPKDWEVNRIKYICEFNPSNKNKFLDSEIISYSPMECIKNGYMINQEIQVSNLVSGLTYFEENDILMAKVTPCFENGNIAIANNLTNGVGYGSSELFVFRTLSVNRKWLFYFLRNTKFTDLAKSTMTGTGGLKRVSPIFVKNLLLAVPPLDKQEKISNYLDKKCSQIDNLIKIKEEKIQKLNDYKKSIIYEYVTGKKEA